MTNLFANHRIVAVAVLLSALLVFGTAGYMVVEGWTLNDAFYMTVITISTVGYGEERPLTARGEIFTILLILVGVSSAAFTFATFTDYIVAGELRGAWRRRRMDSVINKLENHFIVCGYGRVGNQVVDGLRESHVDVVVIDRDPDLGEELDEIGIPYIIANSTEDEALVEAGIGSARGLCACLPHDAENVFVVLSARALNPQLTIIARTNLTESASKLKTAGADQIINPYLITGRRMAAQLLNPTTVELLDVVMQRGELQLRIEEITIGDGSIMDDKTLAECNVRIETGANVLAVRQQDGKIQTDLGSELRLKAGDMLVALGTPEQLAALAENAADRLTVGGVMRRITTLDS